ncbi:4Fe-4S ferredoxin iron-sulfur binding domain-containing protein [Desulfovibrio sp. X2]|uniref:ATP-binding protein n=1 Tax=Desulfovibrio sp. X2 TaxID=941449 RepID=UPI0003589A7E|nr:4Fe-4S binding protein [Desulfovibrio sp. X2]EPR37492.1 4Fe-4S ferredoxin iron-sulfur binding domain-containing protein [Desulfovibrio sp. X2]
MTETKVLRKIIEIDEERCDGCGACIPSCAEGALAIVDGKARIVKDIYCDGLGACLGHCPQGALRVIEREAEDFDEAAAHAHVARMNAEEAEEKPTFGCGCPGSAMMQMKPRAAASGPCACMGGDEEEVPAPASALSHWPVKIKLVPPNAPFLRGADLVVAADCAPVALAGFNPNVLAGKVVMIGCPKFDDVEAYLAKFTEIFEHGGVRSVTVLRMEVPCCTGLSGLVHRAAQLAGSHVPVKDVVITRNGDMLEQRQTVLA